MKGKGGKGKDPYAEDEYYEEEDAYEAKPKKGGKPPKGGYADDGYGAPPKGGYEKEPAYGPPPPPKGAYEKEPAYGAPPKGGYEDEYDEPKKMKGGKGKPPKGPQYGHNYPGHYGVDAEPKGKYSK